MTFRVKKLKTKFFLAVLLWFILLLCVFFIFIQQFVAQDLQKHYLEEKLTTLKIVASMLENDFSSLENTSEKIKFDYIKLNKVLSEIKKKDQYIRAIYVLVPHSEKHQLMPLSEADLNTQDRILIENDLFQFQVTNPTKEKLNVHYQAHTYQHDFFIPLKGQSAPAISVEIDQPSQKVSINHVPILMWQNDVIKTFSQSGTPKLLGDLPDFLTIQSVKPQKLLTIQLKNERRTLLQSLTAKATEAILPSTLFYYESVFKRGLPEINFDSFQEGKTPFFSVVVPLYRFQKQPIGLLVLETSRMDHFSLSHTPFFRYVVYGVLFFGSILFAFAYFFIKRLFNPVQEIALAIRVMNHEHNEKKLQSLCAIHAQRRDEVGELSRSVSYLLQTLYVQAREFEKLAVKRNRDLDQALQRFKNMFQKHAAIMYLIDPSSLKFIDVNNAAITFYGYNRERLLTKSLDDINLLSKNQLQEHMHYLMNSRTSKPFEFKHALATGEIRDVMIFANIIEIEENKLAYFAVVFDITERALLQKRNHQIQIKLRNIIHTAANGIITVNRYGVIQSCNPAGLKMFGYENENELIMHSASILMPPDFAKRHEHFFEHDLKTGLTNEVINVQREILAKRQDDSIFSAYLTLSQIEDEVGSPLFVAIVTDLSKQKQYEQTLIESKEKAEQANRTKDNFVAYTIHELRSPLNTILGSIEILKEDLEEANHSMSMRYLDIIKHSSDRLLRFSNDLLDISKMEAGQMTFHFKRNALRQIVNEAIYEIDVQAQRLTVKIMTNLMPQDEIECDAFRIGQVIRNFLSNALKYAPTHSLVEVQTCLLDAETILLSVRDEGMGIPEGKESEIFERYIQGSQARAGTGLGLTLSKQIIEAHQGKIGAKNHEVKGAIFWFQIPKNRLPKN